MPGLDPIGIRRMKETIVARARGGAAVLVSSHLLHLVEEICSRIVIINKGRVIFSGTPQEVLNETGLASLEDAFVKLIGSEEGLFA